MGWNHRVMRHEDGRLAVHEVFYDKAGRPEGYSAEPATFGLPEDNLNLLILNLLNAARNARTLPVLEPEDFEREG
jgi:hypothetical protein